MPYYKNDYPNTMKNLKTSVRLKAIDILNALITEGYKEEDAIPISISQAKEWIANATEKELSDLDKKDITKHKQTSSNKPARLMDSNVNVYYDENEKEWAVKSVGAKKVSSYHNTESAAVTAAKDIADNRESKVIKHNKDK